MKTYVVDTNIILDNVDNLFKLFDKENQIIIPETVVDELDTKKTLFDEIGYQARSFARLIESMQVIDVKDNINSVETKFKNSNLILTITAKKKYDLKENEVNPNILNDRKIIEVAKLYHDAIFITFDSMCKIRAISEGIKTESLGKQEIEPIKFVVEIKVKELPKEQDDITEINPEHKQENYNYLIEDENGNKKIARIFNNRLHYIDERHLEKQDVKPLNLRQKFFTDAMLDTNIQLTIVNAIAGTGKTLLAISTALRLVKEKKYSKIVYIRNSIESLDKGEEVGFLSGNEEKFAIYNHPLYDSLEFIVRKKLERSNENKSRKVRIDNSKIKEEVQNLIEENCIETMWIGELRGRTISDAFVIVDELQNFSKKSAQLVLTRLNKDCKVVAIGSNKQIDNLYVNKFNNALTTLVESTRERQVINTWCGELTNVVRGPITEFAESIFK